MDRNEVRVQIDRILRSDTLANKGKLVTLLRFLSENMDSQACLKPDRVILELWPDELDEKKSSDVAKEINRLRNALESYYCHEGVNDPIVVTLPKRTAPGPDGNKEKRWIAADVRPGAKDASVLPTPLAAAPQVAAEAPHGLAANSRRRWMLALLIAPLLALAFLASRFFFGDPRPQSARLDGMTLTVANAEGKELWHKSFPDGFWSDYYESGLATRTWFGDLEGNGHTEVLFLYHPANGHKPLGTTLICFSETGKERWRWTPGKVLAEIDGPPIYNISGLEVLKAPQSQARKIVVSSNQVIFYPNQIALVDSNGHTLSEYWHSGWLSHLALADLDGDGREEVIASGVNNGYHQATLVVLDADRISGASLEEKRPELQLHGMTIARERLRVLFPRSDLNQALYEYNEGSEISVGEGKLQVSVREGRLRPGGVFIWYEFDQKFHLLSATADDQFRGAHKEFFAGRANNHPFGASEEAAFGRIPCLRGCEAAYLPLIAAR